MKAEELRSVNSGESYSGVAREILEDTTGAIESVPWSSIVDWEECVDLEFFQLAI